MKSHPVVIFFEILSNNAWYCFRLARRIQLTKKTQNSNGDDADDADVDDADHCDDAGYV